MCQRGSKCQHVPAFKGVSLYAIKGAFCACNWAFLSSLCSVFILITTGAQYYHTATQSVALTTLG